MSSPIVQAFVQEGGTLTAAQGSEDPAAFDLLLMDGDTQTGATLRAHPLVRQAALLGLPLLAVDMSEDDKAGLTALYHVSVPGQSQGLLLRLGRGSQSRETFVVHQGTLQHLQSTRLSSPAQESPLAFLKRAAWATERWNHSRSLSVQGLVGNNEAPTNLLAYTYHFNELPFAWSASGAPDGGKADPRTQVLSFGLTTTVTALLEANERANGDYQWIVTRVEGQASPGSLLANGKYGVGFFQDSLSVKTSLIPGNGVQASVLPVNNTASPQTPNDTQQVETSISFNVGLSASLGSAEDKAAALQPQGVGASSSFEYSSSVTKDITDWTVYNQSQGSSFGWQYVSQHPFDALKTYGFPDNVSYFGAPCPRGFHYVFPDPVCHVQSPNKLNISTMEFATVGAWKTDRVVNGPVVLNVWAQQNATRLGIPNVFLTGTGVAQTWNGRGFTHQIDLGPVVPDPVQSLAFSPAVARPGDVVTVKVNLERPAPADRRITLTLATGTPNSDVSVVGDSAGILIPQGQSSGTAQIKVGLSVPTTSVQVSAYAPQRYTQTFDVQR